MEGTIDDRKSTFLNPCYEESAIYSSIDECKSEAYRVEDAYASCSSKKAPVAVKKKRDKVRLFTMTCFPLLVLFLVGAIVLGVFAWKEIASLQKKLLLLEVHFINSHNLTAINNLWVVNNLTVSQLNRTNSLVDVLLSSKEKLESSYNTLSSKLSSIDSQVGSLEDTVKDIVTENFLADSSINSLQLSVANLTAQINSSINWYQNCLDYTEICSLGNGTTWRRCATPSLPITIEVGTL